MYRGYFENKSYIIKREDFQGDGWKPLEIVDYKILNYSGQQFRNYDHIHPT